MLQFQPQRICFFSDISNPSSDLDFSSDVDTSIPNESSDIINIVHVQSTPSPNSRLSTCQLPAPLTLKSEIVCREKPDFGKDCEILWSSVKIGNCKTLHLASCYRPPNSPQDVLKQFSDSFNCVFESSNHHPNIIAAGDFNLGDIDWSAEVPFAINSVTSALHNRLLRITEDFSLTQHVKCATRPTSGKTLDSLFSSYPNVISDVHTIPGMSDHLVILFHINVKRLQDHLSLHIRFMTTKEQISMA